MPPKKAKKPRARRAATKKKGLKQKQKQKQVVNVQVSSGGSGGGGGFVPVPSAPEINYNLLAQLIRPANTVDVPIRAQANPEPLAMRPAEEPSLAEEMPTAKARKVRSDIGKPRSKPPLYATMTEREAGYETFPTEESDVEIRNLVRKQESKAAGMLGKFGSFERDPFI